MREEQAFVTVTCDDCGAVVGLEMPPNEDWNADAVDAMLMALGWTVDNETLRDICPGQQEEIPAPGDVPARAEGFPWGKVNRKDQTHMNITTQTFWPRLEALRDKLVPDEGPATTSHGELLRCLWNVIQYRESGAPLTHWATEDLRAIEKFVDFPVFGLPQDRWYTLCAQLVDYCQLRDREAPFAPNKKGQAMLYKDLSMARIAEANAHLAAKLAVARYQEFMARGVLERLSCGEWHARENCSELGAYREDVPALWDWVGDDIERYEHAPHVYDWSLSLDGEATLWAETDDEDRRVLVLVVGMDKVVPFARKYGMVVTLAAVRKRLLEDLAETYTIEQELRGVQTTDAERG